MEEIDDKKEGDVPTIPEPVNTPAPADTPPPAQEAAVAEASPPKFSDAFRSRIKSAYPDQEFADDESFFQKASEQLDNLEQYRNQNMEANKALMEIFNAEPAIKDVLVDMIEGASFREALSRHFSADELTPQEGDPDREGWKRNAEARAKRLEENETNNKKRAENEEFTIKEIRAFADRNNITPDKAEEALDAIGKILDEAYSGRLSSNLLQTIYDGVNHANDIKNASETAKIAGRNEKIDIKKEEKPKGDGLPSLSNSKAPEAVPKKKDWMSNLVDSEKRKQIL